MIYYLTTSARRHIVETFLKGWGQSLAGRVELLPYEQLTLLEELPPATYVFGLAGLSSSEVEAVGQVWDGLARAGEGFHALNDPRRGLGRFEFLRTLHEQGINDYGVRRASDLGPDRFPVFVRSETHHVGSLSGVLGSPEELERALDRARADGYPLDDLLVVDYCDTADAEGVFRKYSAFLVGERVVPRHLIFSRDWVVKLPDLLGAARVREELAYLRDNPHEEWVREVFHHANIDYGRIDYGLYHGRPQAWEINPDPVVMRARESYADEHRPAQEHFRREIVAAFEAIDSEPVDPDAWAEVVIEPELAERLFQDRGWAPPVRSPTARASVPD